MKVSLRLTILTAALSCGSLAHGQTVYKYQSSDGRTVYSDKVPRGVKVQKELSQDSELSIIAPSPIARAERTSEASPEQVSRRDFLWRERNRALAELQAARTAKADGEEPQPGERTGNARGGARLNETYWARQDQLDRNIERAQRKLERTERDLREIGS